MVFLEKQMYRRIFSGGIYDHDVYITRHNYAETLLILGHEFGHALGSRFSFKNREVLTPDEVKTNRIPLTFFERLGALYFLFVIPDVTVGFSAICLSAFNKMITAYTKGGFDPNEMRIHFNTPAHIILDMMHQYGSSSVYDIQTDGEILLKRSREARNHELPAQTVSFAMWTMLINSLKLPPILQVTLGNPYPNEEDRHTPHARTWKIVERAYQSMGWIVPSLADLEENKNI